MLNVRPGGCAGGRMRFLELLLAPLLLLAACGPGRLDEQVVLEVLMADDWAEAPAVAAAVRDFEGAHPGVRVDVRGIVFEYMADTVRASIRREDPPAVAQWHAFAAGAQGLAEPLDDVWQGRLDEREFLEGSIHDVEWGRHRYGVPLDPTAMLLLYEPGMVPGLRPGDLAPWRSFHALQAAASAATSPDGARRAIAIPSSTWHAYGWIRANGGEVVRVGSGGEPVLTFDHPKVVEGLSFLAGLVRSGLAFPPVGARGDRIDAFDLFRSGRAAIHASGSWDLAALQREGRKPGVALMPAGTSGRTAGTAMGGSSLFVPKGSPHRRLAVDLMLHLISDRYALRLAREEGRLPARKRIYEDALFKNPEMEAFRRQLESAEPFRLEAFPAAHRVFAQAVEDALLGRKEPPAALGEAQRRAREAVSADGY